MNSYLKRIFSAAAMAVAVVSLNSLSAAAEMTPNPVISRNCPAYSGSAGQPGAANDEHYFSFCFMSSPDYLAYDLSAVPEEQRKQVIAVWYNTSSFDNIGNYASRNMEPSDYTVEVNSAPGGDYPESGWEVVETVEGNTLSSRQHLVNMEGYNWIRLNISKADGEEGKQVSINFDIHNVSEGVTDSWLFLGDSITAGGMNNCYGTGFATCINTIDSRYFPIQENGGIGGIRSIDGRENIDRWLSVSHARYVSIAYGTNDCWGNPNAVDEYYENTKYMIDAILAAGKIPVLPKIPASTNADVKDNVPLYNAVVDKLYEEYGDKLIKGPDFETVFSENPDYLSGDGVHPSDEGYSAMREIWAKIMYENVYSAESKSPESMIIGDVDNNGVIDARDASLVLNEYVSLSTGALPSFTEEQQKAADVNGDGSIDSLDAFIISDYYSERLTGSMLTMETLIGNTDDGKVIPELEKNASNGFTEEEIANSKVKPKFKLTAEPDAENDRIINLQIDVSGAMRNWSTMGFVLDYDERLTPEYNGYILKVKWGDAVSSLSHSVTENKDKKQLSFCTIGKSDMGTAGTVATIRFKIPDDVTGVNDYSFGINYNGGELFTDIKDSERARLMQAYLFTNGLDSTQITVNSGEEASTDEEEILYGDANCDGKVTIADSTAILQHVGNQDKYPLSPQGEKNADCCDPGSGVTGLDAISIQKLDAKQLTSLPEFLD